MQSLAPAYKSAANMFQMDNHILFRDPQGLGDLHGGQFFLSQQINHRLPFALCRLPQGTITFGSLHIVTSKSLVFKSQDTS